MDRLANTPAAERDAVSRAWWPVLLGLLVAALLLAALNVRHAFQATREQYASRLQSQVNLLGLGLAAWQARQMAMAGYLAGSRQAGESLQRWLVSADVVALAQLQSRLADYARAADIDAVLLLSATGQLLPGQPTAAPEIAEPLRAAAHEAVAKGVPVATGLYRSGGVDAPLRLDLVVPLLHSGNPVRGVVVLQIDLRRELLPMLQAIARSPTGARMQLWQHAGEQVLVLNGAPVPAAGQLAPRSAAAWASAAWPAARALRGDWPAGQAQPALDEAGVAVLAAAVPVKGMPGWLVGEIEQATVYAPAWRSTYWTLGVALLLLLGLALASRLWRHRRAQAQRERQALRARVQALGLLEAIAQSSTDAIFAKERQGRYIFYNRAACDEVGMARRGARPHRRSAVRRRGGGATWPTRPGRVGQCHQPGF